MHPKTDLERFSAECAQSLTFGDLVALQKIELSKFDDEVEIICGPITTGGRGSVQKNLTIFNAVISRMLYNERPSFSQMPYEDRLLALQDEWRAQPENRHTRHSPVLEEFYLPLFETKRITRAWFIPGWKSSNGAVWERFQLERACVNVVDLTKTWVDNALRGFG